MELKDSLAKKRPSTSDIGELDGDTVKKSMMSFNVGEKGECNPPLQPMTKPVLPFLMEDGREDEIDLDEGYFSIVR